MTDNLTYWSSWASIASFFISLVSFVLIGSIKSALKRRKQALRLRSLSQEIASIPDDAVPLSEASISKLESIKLNVPLPWIPLTKRWKIVRELHLKIERREHIRVRELLSDLEACTGD